MERKKHVFSCIEKKYFRELIKKHYNVIECKETDGASLRRKNDAWEKITAKYNSSPHTYSQVTVKQLRRLWMNIKQRQREALRNERRYRLANGGDVSIKHEAIDQDMLQTDPLNITSETDSGLDTKETTSENYVEVTPAIETYEGLVHNSPESPVIPTATLNHNSRTPNPTCQCQKSVLEREYRDKKMKSNEKHRLELLILQEELRERKAKADLAEFVLKQKQQQSFPD